MPTLIDDLAGVLKHLADRGWERPLLAGHCWGGHLVWHAATTLAGHIGGAPSIDPLGAVGDMGLPAFGAAISERMTPEARAGSDELEERWETPGLTEAESIEQTRLILPGYFADPANVDKFLAAGEAAPIGFQFDSLMRAAHGMRALLQAAALA